ncbi:hypothetical protein U1Q18_029310, partial [Sarracenia purpurea var. burkii]
MRTRIRFWVYSRCKRRAVDPPPRTSVIAIIAADISTPIIEKPLSSTSLLKKSDELVGSVFLK